MDLTKLGSEDGPEVYWTKNTFIALKKLLKGD